MSQEPLTLYKLMIMYMLNHLEFPLTIAQLSEFFVSRRYTSYFHLQQSVNELLDSSFIRGELYRNTTRFYLTESGAEAIAMFEHKISDAIKEDILEYFKEHHYELRRETDITADYYPTKSGEYMVNARIREKGSVLLELNINVVSREQAVTICDEWSRKSEEVYNTIVRTLLLAAPSGETEN